MIPVRNVQMDSHLSVLFARNNLTHALEMMGHALYANLHAENVMNLIKVVHNASRDIM